VTAIQQQYLDILHHNHHLHDQWQCKVIIPYDPFQQREPTIGILHTIANWVETLPYAYQGLQLQEVLHLANFEDFLWHHSQLDMQEELEEHDRIWKDLWVKGLGHTGAV
jgi:hypothetical protein